MPLVTANGSRFHVQQLGRTGPPVVMLHGLLFGSIASWYFTAAPSIAQSHRVTLYDLRGHGRSDCPPAGYDVATMAGDLGALLDRLPHTPVALVGHSYGALIALRYALDHPTRVAQLALVEAPLPPGRLPDQAHIANRSPQEMLAVLPGPIRDRIARSGRQTERLIARLRRLLQETSLRADIARQHDEPDEALRALACPTLCLYGEESRCRSAGERLRATMPDAQLEVLPGGHYLHLEATPAVTQLICAHLRSPDNDRRR